MPKPSNYRLQNRIVTFLPPADLLKFKEEAFQQNLCAAELMRKMVRNFLAQQNKPGPNHPHHYKS
jgi:hypothetical protein